MSILTTDRLAEATRPARAGDPQAATALPRSAPADDPVRKSSGARTAPSEHDGDLESPFTHGRYDTAGRSLDYKLFSPARAGAGPASLLVMLHGCTQDADDFARGTQMNAVAETSGMHVLYPIQSRGANMNRCWNWFEPTHQRRDGGEPAALSGLTRQIVADHAIDPRRVFVAGLSAGGAMALILAEQYPELFAGVGVHSGLPTRAASSMLEALSAMRSPSSRSAPSHGSRGTAGGSPPHTPFHKASPIAIKAPLRSPSREETTPVIVFHGAMDRTVNRANGELIVSRWLADNDARATPVDWTRSARAVATADGRTAAVVVYRSASQPDRVGCEFWQLDEAGHTWSGGSGTGSHTDSGGPNASEEMMRFFLAC